MLLFISVRKQLELDPHVYTVAKDLDEALYYGNELMLEGKCDRIWVLGGQRLFEVCKIGI